VIVTHHIPTRSDHTTDHTASWDCYCQPRVKELPYGYEIKHRHLTPDPPEGINTADTPLLTATTCDDRGNDWNLPCELPWRHTGDHQWEDRTWPA
jgi:hypothetical protein